MMPCGSACESNACVYEPMQIYHSFGRECACRAWGGCQLASIRMASEAGLPVGSGDGPNGSAEEQSAGPDSLLSTICSRHGVADRTPHLDRLHRLH